MDSSFWPWRKTTEHSMQAHFISSPEKIQNNAVCRARFFWLFFGTHKEFTWQNFWKLGILSIQLGTLKQQKTYGGGCVELGDQHRAFCCCMTMQDRTLLAQQLKLWRRWSLRFSPWLGAKRFPFLSSPQEGSQGDSFHLRWWQAVTSWFKQRTPEFFIDGMRKLVLRWPKMYWTTRRLCRKISMLICSYNIVVYFLLSFV